MILFEYAFDRKNFGPVESKISVNQLNPSISSRVIEVRDRILGHFNEFENGQAKKLTLVEWADLAIDLWVFSE